METRDSQNTPEPAKAAQKGKACDRWFDDFTLESGTCCAPDR